jgi:broad specificity phosphatase PhoE
VAVLALVRHGEPTSYRDGGLTPTGRAQATAAATLLAPLLAGSTELVPVWTSPARRCRETARLLTAGLRARGVPVSRVVRRAPALEMVRADLAGELVDVGLARDRAGTAAAAADLQRFWSDHRAGRNPFERWEASEYPTFETPDVVAERVRGFLQTLDRPVLVVSHSELIRLALPLLGLADESVPFGGVVVAGTIDPGRPVTAPEGVAT